MSFDWAEYLNLAEALTKKIDEMPNREAVARAAISRAYYAAFKKAEEFVVKHDGFVVITNQRNPSNPQNQDEEEPNFGSSHVRVIRQFTKFDPNQARFRNRRKIGLDLRRLKHNRESADYQADFDGNIDEALNETILKAREIINKLKYLV